MQKQPLLGLTLLELQTVVKNLGMPGFYACPHGISVHQRLVSEG